jgi:hypothetical protein
MRRLQQARRLGGYDTEVGLREPNHASRPPSIELEDTTARGGRVAIASGR